MIGVLINTVLAVYLVGISYFCFSRSPVFALCGLFVLVMANWLLASYFIKGKIKGSWIEKFFR